MKERVMNEQILLILASFLVGGILIWSIMKKRINQVNEVLSDKQVVINELANYAEKISNEVDGVVIKKSTKKAKTAGKKETKKVDVKPKTKKKTKTIN
jgi:hypothetical protein